MDPHHFSRSSCQFAKMTFSETSPKLLQKCSFLSLLPRFFSRYLTYFIQKITEFSLAKSNFLLDSQPSSSIPKRPFPSPFLLSNRILRFSSPLSIQEKRKGFGFSHSPSPEISFLDFFSKAPFWKSQDILHILYSLKTTVLHRTTNHILTAFPTIISKSTSSKTR